MAVSRALLLTVWMGAFGASAVADTRAAHVTLGEQLARESRWSEAIAEFKRADAIEPRAQHACLIALAYVRREAWGQAQVFLAQCHARATPSDPVPAWLAPIEADFAKRLAGSAIAEIEIVVEPASLAADTTLELSSFMPDEKFEPRVIALPVGSHLVTARRPGHAPVQRAIEITDRSPQRIVISFDEPAPALQSRPSRAPTVVMAVGGAVVLAGAVFHVAAFKPVRDKLVDATDPDRPDPATYDAYSSSFNARRTATIALYGAGAAIAVTGLILRYTTHRERGPQLTSSLERGQVVVGVEWTQ